MSVFLQPEPIERIEDNSLAIAQKYLQTPRMIDPRLLRMASNVTANGGPILLLILSILVAIGMIVGKFVGWHSNDIMMYYACGAAALCFIIERLSKWRVRDSILESIPNAPVAMGCIVQANWKLFQDRNVLAPALVVYSLDPHRRFDMAWLRWTVQQIAALKGLSHSPTRALESLWTAVNDEDAAPDEALDPTIFGAHNTRIAYMIIDGALLPGGRLTSKFVPILILKKCPTQIPQVDG